MQSQMTHDVVKITISDFVSNKCTILLLYMVPDHLGMAKVSRIHSSLSHRFLAPMSRVNQKQKILLFPNTMCVPVVYKNVALSLNDWYENVCHQLSVVGIVRIVVSSLK